jgi:hypothetical protein
MRRESEFPKTNLAELSANNSEQTTFDSISGKNHCHLAKVPIELFLTSGFPGRILSLTANGGSSRERVHRFAPEQLRRLRIAHYAEKPNRLLRPPRDAQRADGGPHRRKRADVMPEARWSFSRMSQDTPVRDVRRPGSTSISGTCPDTLPEQCPHRMARARCYSSPRRPARDNCWRPRIISSAYSPPSPRRQRTSSRRRGGTTRGNRARLDGHSRSPTKSLSHVAGGDRAKITG